jgi:predicted RNase H-like HicB family nuclease
MECHFTLEYWIDDSWYVGKLKEIPGVFSQGENLEDLENNIKDAYQLMLEEEKNPLVNIQVNTKDIVVQL